MNKFHTLLFIAVVFLASCQSASNKRRSTDQYYTSSGIEKFYLSEIPEWLNFSKSGQCVRQSNVRFLDFPKVMEQFSYQYFQAIQFQYLLNQLRRDKMLEVRANYLLLKDEEIVFYDTVDKIQNGIYPFDYGKYKRIHLVWLDPALKSEEGLKQLLSLLKNDRFNEGYPILVSLCMDAVHLKQFMIKSKIYEGVGILPFELFSVFDASKAHLKKFSLDFSKLFSQDQKLHLYLPKEEVKPEEFVGEIEIHNY